MSSNQGKKSGSNKQEQSWWDKVFGTNGLVGLFAVLVPLAALLYTTHTWPSPDRSSGSGATTPDIQASTPGIQASTAPLPTSNRATTRATEPPAMSQSVAQSAVTTALLTPTDLVSAFGDMQAITITALSSSDYQCQPSGQPPKLATAQTLFGTNGLTGYQAVEANDTSYSNVYERVNAYNNNDTSALAQYLERYEGARTNCSDTYDGLTVVYQVISGAPSLCDQSFVVSGKYSSSTIAQNVYEAFIRCGNLYAYVAILLGNTSNISQGAVYGLLETAANKLRDTANG